MAELRAEDAAKREATSSAPPTDPRIACMTACGTWYGASVLVIVSW